MSSESLFDKLSKINVNDKTEQKGKFTYLSWSFAWAELKKVAPNAKVTVYHNEKDGMPYFASDGGVIVKVGVEVDGIEHISYLPCMDFKNKAISIDSFDMMDVNKAIQRATVKAIGLHGLGLYIYAGEDLPEEEREEGPKKTSTRKKKETKEAAPKESTRSRRTRSKKDETPVEASEASQEEVPPEVVAQEEAPKRRGFRRNQ